VANKTRRPCAGVREALAALAASGRGDTELGAALCVSSNTVWRWRTGRTNPHPELGKRIKKMAQLVG
jgi:hypothetical protein